MNLHPDAATRNHEPLAVPERALTIAAHPDDAEFGAGGTLAKWANAGCQVSMLVMTDGSKGTWDTEADPAELIRARRAEQERAAAVMGATGELVFLDRVDGELESDIALREEVALWIRRIRPDVVMGFDPWKRYMLHPDHRAAGWALVDAVVAARDHLFFTHQLGAGVSKHRPGAIMLFSADQPDHWEDISATFDLKIEALLTHSSQTSTTMADAAAGTEQRQAFEQRMRAWCRAMGEPVGLELAEAFKLIRS